MIHHLTIRKYTAALLNLFSDLEIQYKDSNGGVHTRNIPIKYSTKEKYKEFDNYTSEQLKSGNVNILPRGALALSTMIKSDPRVMNKNMKTNPIKNDNRIEFMYNSVPYEFTFEMGIMCRGMNEAAMIIEQIAPRFNPIVNIDIWDAENLSEPTRIPVSILDIGIESNEYDEYSSNVIIVNVGLSIKGNLYQAIKSTEQIKQYKIYMGLQNDDTFKRASIFNFDVDDSGSPVQTSDIHLSDNITYPPTIIDIVGINVGLGDNELSVIFDDKDNKSSEIRFEWSVIGPGDIVSTTNHNAILNISAPGTIEIQCTIFDVYNNFSSYSKIYNI